jgi:STAM-binding protein
VPEILNGDGLHGQRTMSQDKNDSVLSLDDDRWSLPAEGPTSVSLGLEAEFAQLNIRQPSPPPVLAQVHPERGPIPPSRVADPRPGLARSDNGCFQNVHVVCSQIQNFLMFYDTVPNLLYLSECRMVMLHLFLPYS